MDLLPAVDAPVDSIEVAIDRIRHGVSVQRKQAFRWINHHSDEFSCDDAWRVVVPALGSSPNEVEVGALRRIVERVIMLKKPKSKDEKKALCNALLPTAVRMLENRSRFFRRAGAAIITRVVSRAPRETFLHLFSAALASGAGHETCTALAVAGGGIHFSILLKHLSSASFHSLLASMQRARFVAARIVFELPSYLRPSALRAHLPALVTVLQSESTVLLKDHDQRIQRQAARAVAGLATAAYPFGFEALRPLIGTVLEQAASSQRTEFLEAAGALCALMPERLGSEASAWFTSATASLTRRIPQVPDVALRALCAALRLDSAPVSCVRRMIEAVVTALEDVAMKCRSSERGFQCERAYGDACVALAKHSGASFVALKLCSSISRNADDGVKRLFVGSLRRLLAPRPSDIESANLPSTPWSDTTLNLDSALGEKLGEASLWNEEAPFSVSIGTEALKRRLHQIVSISVEVLATLPMDGRGVGGVSDCLALIAAMLTHEFAAAGGALSHVFEHLTRLLSDAMPYKKRRGTLLVKAVAPALAEGSEALGPANYVGKLATAILHICESSGGDDLGDAADALVACLDAQRLEEMEIEPPVSEVGQSIAPLMYRQLRAHSSSLGALGRLVSFLSRHFPSAIATEEWLRITEELTTLLSANTPFLRRVAVQSIGDVALAAGALDVLAQLLQKLRAPDRTLRVSATSAIALISESAPHVAIPLLLNEYMVPELSVRTGVLKAVASTIQRLGPAVLPYAKFLVPLITDALADRDPVHRQHGAAALKHLALAVAGRGGDEEIAHCFNYLFPNMFEKSPHVISAVMEAFEACAVVLGAGYVMNHVFTGLFHAARHVRKAHWLMHNTLYVNAPDELVQSYPQLDEPYNDPLASLTL